MGRDTAPAAPTTQPPSASTAGPAPAEAPHEPPPVPTHRPTRERRSTGRTGIPETAATTDRPAAGAAAAPAAPAPPRPTQPRRTVPHGGHRHDRPPPRRSARLPQAPDHRRRLRRAGRRPVDLLRLARQGPGPALHQAP